MGSASAYVSPIPVEERYIAAKGGPMTSSPPRVLCVGLLIGLIAGCGRGSGNAAPQSPPPASSVTADDIQNAPGESIEEVLQGRIAGVTVTRTADGGIAVRIRGQTSLTS